jgi:hypothetical protein
VDADIDELAVDADPDPGRDRVVAALDAVPASQRAALVLHHLDGFSMREVADLLGKTEKAVESLLGRGRETLRRVGTSDAVLGRVGPGLALWSAVWCSWRCIRRPGSSSHPTPTGRTE